MKLNIKNRTNGTTFQIEVSPSETLRGLRSKISSNLGKACNPHNLRLLLGEEPLNYGESVTINEAGLVSGDKLFVEIVPSGSSAESTVVDAGNAQLSNERNDSSMNSDDDLDVVGEFRDRIVRAAREYMEGSGYSNSSLQSWTADNASGSELRFEMRSRGHTTEMFVIVTALPKPSLSAIVNVGRLHDGSSRTLLSSFTVQPASVKDNVAHGVATALSTSGAKGVTLVHLISLRCVRERLLAHMGPRTVTRLSGVNHLLRSVLLAPSVDRSYWMHALSRDFGQEKVQEAQQKGGTFRMKYKEEYASRKSTKRGDSLLDERFNPLPYGTFIPPQPNRPSPHPNPDGPLFPAPDPLQPIPDPMNPIPLQPPGANPFGPAVPFGGRNPFDPFDPTQREIFPSRPNQGIPRGGPRYFPANRWDRNDFI